MNRVLVVAIALALCVPAFAQDEAATPLTQRLIALDANADTAGVAAYERLQARQAVDALANARSREAVTTAERDRRRAEIGDLNARLQTGGAP